MKKSWRIRVTSAILAAVMTGSAVAEPVFAAQNVDQIGTVATVDNGGSETGGLATSEEGSTASGIDSQEDLTGWLQQSISESMGTAVTLTPDDGEETSDAATSSDEAEGGDCVLCGHIVHRYRV